MSASSKPLFILNNQTKVLGTGDTGTFDCDVVHAADVTFDSGITVDFTGATVSGLIVGAAYVTDATGTFGFSGAAGVVSSTGISDMSFTGTGTVVFGATSTGTLSLRSATGTSRWGDGTGYLQFGGSGAVTSTGITTFGLSGSGAMTIGTTSTGTLAVRSNTGTATFGDAVGSWVFTGSGGLGTNAVTTLDLDASGAIQINSSAGKIQIGNDAVSQDIDLGTAGTRNINLGSSASTIFVKGPEVFSEGSNSAPIAQSIMKVAGVALSVGKVLAYTATSGQMQLADANGSGATRNPVGTCTFAAAGTGDPTGLCFSGEVPVEFAVAPTAADIGSIVYLSETAGLGTLTAPSTVGSDVVQIGTLAAAGSSATVCRVLLAIRYLYTN